MEKEILEKLNSYDLVVGIDEVGRGPIAGPVTVAAFGIAKKHYDKVVQKLSGITDSKKLTEKKRDHYADIIRELKQESLVSIAIASVSAQVIDRDGISAALRAALKRSLVKTGSPENTYVYLDGSLFAPDTYNQETIIKGDSKNWLIGAASVIAKVTRDMQMKKKSLDFPEYSFENNKGYGTKAHYEAIKKHGMCHLHRTSWIKL